MAAISTLAEQFKPKFMIDNYLFIQVDLLPNGNDNSLFILKV
jgi:hypothetical protein